MSSLSSPPSMISEEWHARSWPVRVVGVLLVVQSVIFAGISIYLLLNQRWQLILPNSVPLESVLTLPHMHLVSIGLLLLILTGIDLIAAVAMIFMHPIGWLLAMIVQALTLAGCLDLYFNQDPVQVYPLMLYSILLVLYLNSSDVRLVLTARQRNRNHAS